MKTVRLFYVVVVIGVLIISTGCKSKKSSSSPDTGNTGSTSQNLTQAAAPTNLKEWQKKLEAQKDCKVIAGETYGATENATNLYDKNAEALKGIYEVKEIANATYQCATEKIGVFIYEFANKAEAESAEPFIEGFLWGENKNPTPNAPERIYMKDKVILILSSKQNTSIDALIK